ncbi:glycosyltransferase family 2 protein [Gimesia sp.]|uniref:glycosyltransferase family 2 protein n=1 Tax=Gimesia sp. TaxID=2024833 RepID=UPI0025BC4240|nr:glycosyltransferase family 2 protein [Gimesia sp.]|tara:strand:- start:2909 stop:3835 length:927 start_codon:yes stop_codon:yes gene_type:complete
MDMISLDEKSEIKAQLSSVSDPFTVIVPCYNELQALPDAIVELERILVTFGPHELIVIDDGSTDGTSAALRSLQEHHPEITILKHETNQGYGASLKTGVRHAKYDSIVITDADGTYPNDRIGDLLAFIKDYDMVVGSRTGENVEYSTLRKIPKYFLKHYASWIAGRNIPDLNSGLRVFKRNLAEKFLSVLPDGFSFTTTITMAHLTNKYSVHYEPINYSRRIGKSKIQPVRDTLRFLQLIIRLGVYFAPLKVFGPFAAIQVVAFMISVTYDVFILQNITDKTIMLLMFSMNTTFFALLADMIDKRSQN